GNWPISPLLGTASVPRRRESPPPPPEYASTMAAPGPISTRKKVPIPSATDRRIETPSRLPGIRRGLHRFRNSAGPEVLREVVRQVARADRLHRLFDVVLDPDELDLQRLTREVEHHVARPPVAVLGAADRARVDEVDALDLTMPRLVRVAETDHVAPSGSGRPGHLQA